MDEPLKHARETARQRALRIPLDYHRTRGALWKWKALLSLVGVLACGLYIAWVLAGGKTAATQVSPGILARDHSRWDSDCKACHIPFVPQRPDADGARMLSLSLASGATDIHQQIDAKCSECHKSAGAHHANQIATDVESCASCHRDHQGRDFDMARMDDAHCTNCHASIARHHNSQSKPPIANVTAFEAPSPDGGTGHPAFRSLQVEEDPGNIRFSHRLHMTLGQLYPGQTAPAGKRQVQLDCDDCHQPETTTGNGAYMRPIKYAQHCRDCHPLNLPGQPESMVPHGLASKQLETTVRGLLAAAQDPAAESPPQRPIPGKIRERVDAGTKVPAELRAAQWMAQLRENKCSQCHSWQDENPNEVQPARISSTWFKHSRFNHQKHKNSAQCLDCHPQAGAKLPTSSVIGKLTDDQQIMIPDIAKCIQCHANPNKVSGIVTARFDCAECHRYHHTSAQEQLRRQGGSSDESAAGWPGPLLQLTLVAHQQAATSPQQKHPFVGTQSCSTAGCHGAAAVRGSSSAFTRFTTDDPHQRAFLLLYSDSSRRIIRRLRGEDQAELSEPAYFSALLEKCLGCHVTPATDTTKSNRAEGYLTGITCESCHGAAAEWEFSHFGRGTKPASLAKLSDLAVRATVCAECHVGPKEMHGKTYDVNHDLIAAGHPRLTFEFEAQLANLPAHWSAAKDIKSHFDAWRVGQLATATQQNKLYAGRAAPEFASHRCFDCHHGLTPKPPAARVAFPQLAVISKEKREWLAIPTPAKQEQAGVLLKLLSSVTDERNNASTGTRWEEHVHFCLALSAFSVDHPQSGELAKGADDLRAILTNSFRSLPLDRKMKAEATFAGGPYDSPTGFDPKDERLQQILKDIRASLTSP
jgi:hypothetical protein